MSGRVWIKYSSFDQKTLSLLQLPMILRNHNIVYPSLSLLPLEEEGMVGRYGTLLLTVFQYNCSNSPTTRLTVNRLSFHYLSLLYSYTYTSRRRRYINYADGGGRARAALWRAGGLLSVISGQMLGRVCLSSPLDLSTAMISEGGLTN